LLVFFEQSSPKQRSSSSKAAHKAGEHPNPGAGMSEREKARSQVGAALDVRSNWRKCFETRVKVKRLSGRRCSKMR
jgi:hypothetical protein